MIYSNEMAAGEFPCKCAVMPWSRPFMNHCHPELEIIKIRQGCLTVSYEGENIVLESGDIWLVPPFASHSIEEGSKDCIRLVVLMEPSLMGMASEPEEKSDACVWADARKLLEQKDMFCRSWDEDTWKQCDGLIEDIYREYIRRQYAWQLAIKTLADRLLLLVARRMPPCTKKPPNKQVQKLKVILEYIARNYCGSISLEECADAVGFNPSYLSRYFSRNMGVTFQEYVKRLRIDRARWLLRTDKMPVTEVGYQCGFNDIKTFNKLFKKETGVSPSQFRKSASEHL